MSVWAAIKYALNDSLGKGGFIPLNKIIQHEADIIKDNISDASYRTNKLFGGVKTFTSNATFVVPAYITKIWITACAGGGKGTSSGFGGDGGDWLYRQPYTVSSGQTISIIVGKGATVSGKSGESTIIGDIVTLACPGIRGGSGGGTSSPNVNGQAGFAPGGIGVENSKGGGGGSLGRGGDALGSTIGNPGILGGGSSGTTGSNAPCNGGDGIVIIEW